MEENYTVTKELAKNLSLMITDVCDSDILTNHIVRENMWMSSQIQFQIVMRIQHERTQKRIASALEDIVNLLRKC